MITNDTRDVCRDPSRYFIIISLICAGISAPVPNFSHFSLKHQWARLQLLKYESVYIAITLFKLNLLENSNERREKKEKKGKKKGKKKNIFVISFNLCSSPSSHPMHNVNGASCRLTHCEHSHTTFTSFALLLVAQTILQKHAFRLFKTPKIMQHTQQ